MADEREVAGYGEAAAASGLDDPAWPTPTLRGDRITLRPYRGADVDALWEMVHDAEGTDLTATKQTFTREQTEAWVAKIIDAEDRIDWVIEEASSGEYAGEVVINERDVDLRTANFRISLRGPAWFGRGLGTEATLLACLHAFSTLRLNTLTLSVLARNPRAQRVYEKAGFLVSGSYHEDDEDWIEMTLTRPRWLKAMKGRELPRA